MAIDYEKYLVRNPVYGADAGTGTTFLSSRQIPETSYYLELGWVNAMPHPAPDFQERPHDCDEIMLFFGGDYRKPQVLGGEIEFSIGGQPITFNTTTGIFIPKGTPHGPLRCKEYRQPHIVMAIMCGAGSLKEGWGDSFVPQPTDST